MENIFTEIYEKCIWGNNMNLNYKGSSGGGSSKEFNENTYIPFLKSFIQEMKIESVVDLGCGDFLCGNEIYDSLNVNYTGYDTYQKIIEYNQTLFSKSKYSFIHLDFCKYKEEIQNGDLCIIKDVLQHWTNSDIYQFLDYITRFKKFKYILIINCCNQTVDNNDTLTGGWRQLSCDFLPLKKYEPKKLLTYFTKEVSLIEI